MRDNLIVALQDWGMSEKESKIYLTVLELGSGAASTIGRRAGIKRVTAYSLLRDLERRKIASRIEKDGVSYFTVISPDSLAEQVKKKYDDFSSVLPQLHAMTDTYSSKPKIEYFEGIDGIKRMYDDLLSSDVSLCSFLGIQEFDERVYSYLLNEFLPQRIKNNIFAKVILPPSDRNTDYVGRDEKAYKESIMIEDAIFSFDGEINLYGEGKVMIGLMSKHELSGLIIHSPAMYKSMLSIFNLIWKTHRENE